MEKVDLNYGYWNPQRKLGVANTFSEIISLESPRKLLTLAFFRKKKDRKRYFFTDFPRVRLYMQKTKQINKNLKLHGKW